MKKRYYAIILVIGMLIGNAVCGEVRIQRASLRQDIVCKNGSMELVLDRAINCMAYSTYQMDLTSEKFNYIQHYCYEGSLEKYGCNGYRLIIDTKGF